MRFQDFRTEIFKRYFVSWVIVMKDHETHAFSEEISWQTPHYQTMHEKLNFKITHF